MGLFEYIKETVRQQVDNVLGEVLGEAEGYTDRAKLKPIAILDDVAVSTSSTQYTIPDISQFTMVQFVLTTCPVARVAYVRDTKTIPVSVLLHNIETYTYNHIITLLGLDPSTTDTWTKCKIEMNSTTQISVSENSGASPDGGARLSIFAW